MAKVFLHLKGEFNDDGWENSPQEFLRLPCVGEYVDPGGEQEGWYEVKLVVHAPFPENEYAAEVYAVAVDHLAVKKQLFGGDTGELLLW